MWTLLTAGFFQPLPGQVLAQADSLWSLRHHAVRSGVLGQIHEACDLYQAEAESGGRPGAVVGVLRCAHFLGTFTGMESGKAAQLFESARTVGEEALRHMPDDPEILYWSAVCWGRWAEETGVFTAAKLGAPDRIRDLLEHLGEVDPGYGNGARERFLGILHLHTPNIPFLLTWPSLEQSEHFLMQAMGQSADPVSCLALAELAMKRDQPGAARIWLHKALAIAPDRKLETEERYYREKAQRLLQKLAHR